MRPFLLSRMIFSYWKHHMGIPVDDLLKDSGDGEGAVYYDGWNATFWYLLNVEWYRMQDRQFAYTGCTELYDELRDFDQDYLYKNFP
jgi:hypothetical protein